MLIDEIRKIGMGEAITNFLEGKYEWAHTVYAYIAGKIHNVSYDVQEGWKFKMRVASGIFFCTFNDPCLLREGDWVEVVGTLRAATTCYPSYVQVVDMCTGEKGIKFSYALVPYPTSVYGSGLQAKFYPNYNAEDPVLGVYSGILYKDPQKLFREDTTYAMGSIEWDRQAYLYLEEVGST